MSDQPDIPEIPFTPVPSASTRRDGWTAERQRGFIDALARCGSVSAAARQVGKSVRGAYALRDRAGAESFAEAWDQAVVIGLDAVRDSVIDRAMHGSWVPVVRRGRVARMEFRHFDKLAIAVLSGRGRDVHEAAAERAWARAVRKADRDAKRAQAEAEARYARELEEAVRRGEEARRAAAQPRVRGL